MARQGVQKTDEVQSLVEALVAVREFHAALDFLAITGKKADQMKMVKRLKDDMDKKIEAVEPLINAL